METSTKCPACQSDHAELAKLDGMAITLDRATALKKLFNPAGAIHCRVCMECGAVTGFRVDPARIAGMLP